MRISDWSSDVGSSDLDGTRRDRMTQRRHTAGHTLAGFTVGLVAAAVGLLFARPAVDEPLNEAARYAEQVAAVQLLADPDTTPGAEAAVPVTPVDFAPDGSPISNRHATRVVIPSVGLDASVRPVGLVFRGGELQYDVPRQEAGQYVGTASPGEAGKDRKSVV